MALLNQSVQVYGKLGELFAKLREGQAPEQFTRPFLKDLGFKSSNWHASIGLLKGLGFLSTDGTPTQRYMEFLDPTRWAKVLGQAVKEAYSDIFVMKREPSPADVQMIAGKYKSTYNVSDNQADRAARTFLALWDLSDQTAEVNENDHTKAEKPKKVMTSPLEQGSEPVAEAVATKAMPAKEIGLNYNIQIHLPATKDIEVYNAIFKSLREHIIE